VTFKAGSLEKFVQRQIGYF